MIVVEIELKVRLEEPEPVKLGLSSLGAFVRSYEKSDTYWFPAAAGGLLPSGVRVRRDRGVHADGGVAESVLVTYKNKLIEGGIEINDEREFAVSDAGMFEDLLRRLGLKPDIQKEKHGWAWSVAPEAAGQPPILAELSMVTHLGWFLEIEIVSEGGGTVADGDIDSAAHASANTSAAHDNNGGGTAAGGGTAGGDTSGGIDSAAHDSGNRRMADESRARLLSLLERLEIPASRIEARPYTQMLRECAR